ncbi:MAG: hypothetical protein CMO80_08385 [Verrucomicrobiales bacterium]|nr:hypothetical protein [Verrucomicrobiales bacterium]
MRAFLTALLIVSMLVPASAFACVNTRYSRADEEKITGDVVKLIMGQFGHRGQHFYEYQLELTALELEKAPKNVEARNDRAVAFLKLKRYNEALEEFQRIEEDSPGRYRTHANLGVLYKKTSEYAKAAEHIQKSLEIQPGGHLGLGDYYLRMIRWLDKVEDMKANSEAVNFLGIPYSAGTSATADSKLVNREFLETLIKADRSFPDVYVVLGDLLTEEKEYELAYRAYERAADLRHPFRKELKSRRAHIRSNWETMADEQEGFVAPTGLTISRQIRNELGDAEEWVAEFQHHEAMLITGDQDPTFDTIKERMKTAKVLEPVYEPAGLFKGERTRDGGSERGLLWASVVFLAVVIVLIWVAAKLAMRLVRKLKGTDDPLNRRFGLDNRIKFSKYKELTVATIQNEHAVAKVCLHGGHVMSFKPHGHDEVLWMSSEAVFEAPKPIRGGVPVCWPWFSQHPDNQELPQHGFARNRQWSVDSSEMRSDGRTRFSLVLRDGAQTHDIWAHAFELVLNIIVGTDLRLELVSRNTGTEPIVVGGALHTYFSIGEIGQVSIEGLDGRSYLDQLDSMKEKQQDGAITIGEEVDRIYINTEDTCVIHDRKLARQIHVAKEGSRSTVVWNPWIDKAKRMGDFVNDGFQEMLCIETTNAHDDLHTIQPGEEHRMVQTIWVGK